MLELNKIYNMDCIEGMKLIDDESIDLIVTDPPYLINYCRHDKQSRFSTVIQNDDNPELISNYIKECWRIMKNDTAMYMFCSAKTVDYFKQELEIYFNIKNMIIWDKQQQGMGDTASCFGFQYEILFLCEKGKTEINGKRYSDIWSFLRITGDKQLHQNQKPVSVIKRCIEAHSNKGDLVFDGFMGSATTAIACIDTKRNYIGFELDKEHFDIAQKRIKQRLNTPTFFDEIIIEQPKIQTTLFGEDYE